MKKTMIVLSVAVGCLIAFAPTVEAQFPKIPGLGGKKKQKAGGFVVPALAFAIEGAPGDPVEMTFFYADATATLFKAASDHMSDAVIPLGNSLGIKVSKKTVGKDIKNLAKELKGAKLTEEQKKLANEANKKLAEAVLLVGVGSLSAKGLVDSIQAVPDHVKSLGRFKAVKYAKYIKNVPKAVKDMGGIVKNSVGLLKNLKEINDTLAKVEGVEKVDAKQVEKGGTEVLAKALKKKSSDIKITDTKKG